MIHIHKNNHISYEQLHTEDTCYGYVLNLKYRVPALEELCDSISNLRCRLQGQLKGKKKKDSQHSWDKVWPTVKIWNGLILWNHWK